MGLLCRHALCPCPGCKSRCNSIACRLSQAKNQTTKDSACRLCWMRWSAGTCQMTTSCTAASWAGAQPLWHSTVFTSATVACQDARQTDIFGGFVLVSSLYDSFASVQQVHDLWQKEVSQCRVCCYSALCAGVCLSALGSAAFITCALCAVTAAASLRRVTLTSQSCRQAPLMAQPSHFCTRSCGACAISCAHIAAALLFTSHITQTDNLTHP